MAQEQRGESRVGGRWRGREAPGRETEPEPRREGRSGGAVRDPPSRQVGKEVGIKAVGRQSTLLCGRWRLVSCGAQLYKEVGQEHNQRWPRAVMAHILKLSVVQTAHWALVP